MVTVHRTSTSPDPKRQWLRLFGTPQWIARGLAARLIVVAACGGLAASYLVTWRLWQPRSTPPNVALLGIVRSVPMGFALIASLAVACVRPKLGAAVHTGLFVVALLGDQIRLQPEFISLAILLIAGAWPTSQMFVARWHLTTLWIWAGVHKLLSLGWSLGGASFIATTVHRPGWRSFIGWWVPLVEISVGLLALWRRTWPVLRFVGAAFHLGVAAVLYLSHTNTAVWPWNVALACVIPLVFVHQRSVPVAPRVAAPGAPRDRPSHFLTAVSMCFVLYPAGFYLGLSDAYPAHNLYSSNTAQASVCPIGQPNACSPAQFGVYESLNVPIPPERRLFVALFRRVCEPDTMLRIDGINTRLRSGRVEYVSCARPALPARSVAPDASVGEALRTTV